MRTWQLQEAKSRFSELVDPTLAEGPQVVTRRGAEVVVVVAAPEYRRQQGAPSLLAVLNNAPRAKPDDKPLDLARDPEPIRDITL